MGNGSKVANGWNLHSGRRAHHCAPARRFECDAGRTHRRRQHHDGSSDNGFRLAEPFRRAWKIECRWSDAGHQFGRRVHSHRKVVRADFASLPARSNASALGKSRRRVCSAHILDYNLHDVPRCHRPRIANTGDTYATTGTSHAYRRGSGAAGENDDRFLHDWGSRRTSIPSFRATFPPCSAGNNSARA